MTTIFRCEALYPGSGHNVARGQGIVEAGGRIVAVDSFEAAHDRYPDARVVDLPGLTLPGFVDAHSHLRSHVAVSQAELPGYKLEAWIYSLPELTELPTYDDALLACAELLSAGVTSVQVMLHSWSDKSGRLRELEHIAKAVTRVGLRAVLILGLTDQAEYVPASATANHRRAGEPQRGVTPAQWGEFVEAAEELIEQYGPTITLGVGPVAPQWCSDEALHAIAQSRGDKRVHAHLLESERQMTWTETDHDQLSRLARAGLLGPFTSLAHAVFASSADLRQIEHAGVSLVHCHTSNSRLSTQVAPIETWHAAGVQVASGLDSQVLGPINYSAELRKCAHTHLDADQAYEMATSGGANALGLDSGRISKSAWADFISVHCELAPEADVPTDVLALTECLLPYSVIIGGVSRLPATAELNKEISQAQALLDRIVDADFEERHSRIETLTADLKTLGFVDGDDQ